MKRFISLTGVVLATTWAISANAAALDREAGLALAKKSGCLACHSIEKKVVGPAWGDVSARYKDNPGAERDRLVNKVKTGGKGNWTDVTGGIPMPPYSPRVADADIEQLVDFVLSLAQTK
jgi:cytochrome c